MKEQPIEDTSDEARQRTLEFERRLSKWLLAASPILLIGIWVSAAMFGKTILFAQPIGDASQFWNDRMGFALAVSAVLLFAAWWATLRSRLSDDHKRLPLMTFAFGFLIFIAFNFAISHKRCKWAFQEIVKTRAPRLSYTRNIVYVEQTLSAHRPKEHGLYVGLVGSSQINLGIDSERLENTLNDCSVQKLCMPGMVPLQYQSIAERVSNQRFDCIVCWLSEFDFFREQNVPTERLRWSMNQSGFRRLTSTLSPKQGWRHRSELADLAFAASLPVWRQRDLFQTLAFRFCWRFDHEGDSATAEEELVGAKLSNRAQGIANAKKNIHRTELLDANFRAFADFAEIVTRGGSRLIVIEGESHPETMAAYPPEYRIETASRLAKLSETLEFEYLRQSDRPTFDESDWLDAVHLNEEGRDRLTLFVADQLASK